MHGSQRVVKDETMEPTKGASATETDDDMLSEYDFSKGERGRYAGRTFNYGLMVSIDSDLAAVFDNAEKVNSALRLLVELNKATDALFASAGAPTAERILAEEKSEYRATSE